jgi:hypothetical protein
MSITAMKQALEVLEDFVDDPRCQKQIDDASIALRQAIEQAEKQEHENEDEDSVGVFVEFTDGILREVIDDSAGVSSYTAPQPQQEPVAIECTCKASEMPFGRCCKTQPVGKFAKFTDGIWREVTDGAAGMPLYTTPQPQREWIGLTDEELKPLCDVNHIMLGAYVVDFIRAIEAKLKEKNNHD